ncbi:MAG: hypothetical protein ABRQ38_11850 [Candidatus Eremiobacterota bacterium]
MIIGSNTQIGQKLAQTPVKRQETSEPTDDFKNSGIDLDNLSYIDNLKFSTLAGFTAGFIHVGKAVGHVMPSVDGLDHPGLHILYAMPSVVAGAVAGVFGGAAGFAMGLFGGNIMSHVTIPEA